MECLKITSYKYYMKTILKCTERMYVSERSGRADAVKLSDKYFKFKVSNVHELMWHLTDYLFIIAKLSNVLAWVANVLLRVSTDDIPLEYCCWFNPHQPRENVVFVCHCIFSFVVVVVIIILPLLNFYTFWKCSFRKISSFFCMIKYLRWFVISDAPWTLNTR